MEILNQKQKEFFDLADNLYIECINKYKNLVEQKNKIDPKIFENEMRFICSQMGLACEYYLKGLIFPYLKISIPEGKENYKSIIESLSDEDVYKILIGDDNILNEISHNEGIKIKDLKFLRQYSIKSSGHNLISLIEKIITSENINMSEDLKSLLIDRIKSYYFNYFGFENKTLEVNANTDDIMNLISNSNISDAFVKGRYGHLDGYNLDYLKLYKLMLALRNCCEMFSGAFSIVNGDGLYGIDNASDITMIFPDQNSKIYILDENGEIVRVYQHMKYSQFLENLYDLAYEKVYKEIGCFNSVEYDKICEELNLTNDDLYSKNWNYYDLTLVPYYGIDEMKKVFIGHDSLNGNYYSSTDLVALYKRLFIDKDKQQTIFLYENGVPVSYTQNIDNKIRKNSNSFTLEIAKKIEQFEKKEISYDKIAEEFINLIEIRKGVINGRLQVMNYEIYSNERMNLILKKIKSLKKSEFKSYLRKTRQLKKERKKLLKEYKKLKSGKKENKIK